MFEALSSNFYALSLGGITALLGLIFLLSYIITPTFSCKGKHVLITGGSYGIGLAVAKEYLLKGANITIVARNLSKLEEAKKILLELRLSSKQEIHVVSLDISKDAESVSNGLKPCLEEMGDVDIIVNCAGTSVAGTFEEVDPAEFEQMMRVNLLGSVYPTRAVVAGMKKKRAGRVVFVSSQVAQVGVYGYTAYAPSKWAVRGLAEVLAMELRPYNVLVSVCYPPDTDTPGYKKEMESKPEITKKISETGQVFTAEDVAKALIHQVSRGYFSVSVGFDGWMLRQLHPGMSIDNNIWEVAQQVMFASVLRLLTTIYLQYFHYLIRTGISKSDCPDKKNK